MKRAPPSVRRRNPPVPTKLEAYSRPRQNGVNALADHDGIDDQTGRSVCEDRQNTRQQEQDEQDFLHFFACDYRTANL